MRKQIMKYTSIAIACVALLAINGCATANHPSRADNRENGAPVTDQQDYRRFESIAYNWESQRIEVLFHRQARDSSWIMTVQDAWDIYEQFKEDRKVWGEAESKCSTEECIRMIDRSLADFH